MSRDVLGLSVEKTRDLAEGKTVKVGEHNNQIFIEDDYFVTEIFVGMNGEEEQYAVFEAFVLLSDALNVANNTKAKDL